MPRPGWNENVLRLPRWLDFRANNESELRTKLGENFRDLSRVLAELRKFQIQTQGQFGDGGSIVNWIRDIVNNQGQVLWRWNGRDTSQFGSRVDVTTPGSLMALTVNTTSYETPALVLSGQIGNGANVSSNFWPVLDFQLPKRFVLEYKVELGGSLISGAGLFLAAASDSSATHWGLHLRNPLSTARNVDYFEGAHTAVTNAFAGVSSQSATASLRERWQWSAEETLSSPPRYSAEVKTENSGGNSAADIVRQDMVTGAPSASWAGKELPRLLLGFRQASGTVRAETIHIRDLQILRHPLDLPILSAGDSGWTPGRVVPTDTSL